MSGFNPNWLVGKTIKHVDYRIFTEAGARVGHAPVIHFTDGSHIHFATEETDGGEYGTSITYSRATGAP